MKNLFYVKNNLFDSMVATTAKGSLKPIEIYFQFLQIETSNIVSLFNADGTLVCSLTLDSFSKIDIEVLSYLEPFRRYDVYDLLKEYCLKGRTMKEVKYSLF